MKVIINIKDQVMGSWHQITVHDILHSPDQFVRLDGSLLSSNSELRKRILQLLGAWEDEFEGVTDKEHYA